MLRLICGAFLLPCALLLGCAPGGSGDSGAGGSGGTIYEPGPACTAFCATVIGRCEAYRITEVDCRQNCEQDIDAERAKSEACGDAVEAVFQCASERGCQDIYDTRDGVPIDDYACQSAVDAVALDCPQN